MAKYESDFIPYTFQIPICVAVAKVAVNYELTDLVVLDEGKYRPHVMTEHFWRGWEKYTRPQLVSFNGRGFDLPLLELAAFRYGISLTTWFSGTKNYEQPRNRFNTNAHLDLHELLTNYGASKFQGGLNLAANLLGKPGKMDVQGDMVQDMFDAQKFQEISDYCRCDVLDTYFVFLRSRVLVGDLTLEEEQALVLKAYQWIESQTNKYPIYAQYLKQWGDWVNPWDVG
jgi:predicted PolB exonuclease-like 3'-5' exonuclease